MARYPIALNVATANPGCRPLRLISGNCLIVGLNGKPFSDVLQLQGDARSFSPGQTIILNINRAGTTLAVPITLCSWEEIEQLEATGGVSL